MFPGFEGYFLYIAKHIRQSVISPSVRHSFHRNLQSFSEPSPGSRLLRLLSSHFRTLIMKNSKGGGLVPEVAGAGLVSRGSLSGRFTSLSPHTNNSIVINHGETKLICYQEHGR